MFEGILLANNVDPDQTPHHVASDLGLHRLPMTFYGFQGKNGLTKTFHSGADSDADAGITTIALLYFCAWMDGFAILRPLVSSLV